MTRTLYQVYRNTPFGAEVVDTFRSQIDALTYANMIACDEGYHVVGPGNHEWYTPAIGVRPSEETE